MWQRIQTLYFVLILILMTLSILLPNASFFDSAKHIQYQLDARGIIELNAQGVGDKMVSMNPMSFLFGIILFVTTFCIFKYNNRKAQFRLATINLLLIFIYICALAVYIIVVKGKLNSEATYEYPLIFPVIALIINYLAMRGILKDDKLVKSLDRLR